MGRAALIAALCSIGFSREHATARAKDILEADNQVSAPAAHKRSWIESRTETWRAIHHGKRARRRGSQLEELGGGLRALASHDHITDSPPARAH